ncbi:hypothetical protein K5D36_17965 [Pseudomonas cichorii]|nr:hypothetical protein [Pseudomonas cichorii]
MSSTYPTVPTQNCERFQAFCDFLRSAPVKPGAGVMMETSHRHHEVIKVTVNPQPESLTSYCWYNCIDHTLLKGGKVIFGWLLWANADYFTAQHHAIWMNDEGALFDITPNAISSETVLFMPDNRAPFDINELRAPASLRWKSSDEYFWIMGPLTKKHFFIGRMEPTTEESQRIETTQLNLANRHELISTLELSASNILYNCLMRNFDDIEKLTSIQSTKEFQLLVQLNEALSKTPRPHLTKTSYDWEILVGAWNALHNISETLDHNHKDILHEISKLFGVNTPSALMLIGSLVSHDVRIIGKLSIDKRQECQDLVRKANIAIRDFRLTLLQYGSAEATDRFFGMSHDIDKRDVEFQKIDVKGLVVYLDTNAVSNLLKKKAGRAMCLEKQKKGLVSFVYSSYLVADAVNMNPFFLKDYIDELLALTQGQMIGTIDNIPCFVKEDITRTLARTGKQKSAAKEFEKQKFIKVIEHYHERPDFRRGKAISSALAESGAAFFSNNDNKTLAEHEQLRRSFQSRKYATEFIESGRVQTLEPHEIRGAIHELLEVLDFCNYETESVNFSNFKKIASSYRDNEHIGHARIADYFVTDDEKLKARGNLIYPIVGSRTQVIGVKDFLDKLPTL